MTEELPQGRRSYALSPAVPLRPLIVSVVLALAGVVGCVVGASRKLSVVLVISIAVLAVALVLVLLGLVLTRRNTIRVDLDETGFHVHGPGLDRRGRWSDVTRVATTPDGSRLVIASGPLVRTHIMAPLGGSDPQMKALVEDISRRMANQTLG
jgi:hypothetical protein